MAAAARYARERTGTGPLWLAGFSFGSWVGSMWALRDGQVERFIGLGMPASTNIDGRTFDFLDRPPAPMLIVQGTRDQYGSREAIVALGERLRAKGPVEVRFVEGADHFFTGHLTQLAHALKDGLDWRAWDLRTSGDRDQLDQGNRSRSRRTPQRCGG